MLDHELGHEIAFAVERGKIAASSGGAQPDISLDQIEPGLSVALPVATLGQILAGKAQMLRIGAQETLQMGGLRPDQIDRVIYVGGSSLMSMVQEVMRAQFPDAAHSFTEVFTAVADGLAISSATGDVGG